MSTHDGADPLVGRPLSDDELAVAERLSAWAESDAFEIPTSAEILVGADAEHEARATIEDLVGAERLDRAINRGGRPSLDGRSGSGPSPKRQVRLPRDVDDRLMARAAAEHREVSELLREAIITYLGTESRR